LIEKRRSIQPFGRTLELSALADLPADHLRFVEQVRDLDEAVARLDLAEMGRDILGAGRGVAWAEPALRGADEHARDTPARGGIDGLRRAARLARQIDDERSHIIR